MPRCIVEATNLPVAADLENGYGHAPEDAAETIRLAAEVGLVGGSIEDATGDAANPIYEFEHAVERIAAAAETAKALSFPFHAGGAGGELSPWAARLGRHDPAAAGFEKGGAAVLYAPGLTQPEDIRTVCSSVTKPVNVLMGMKGAPRLTVQQLGELGVRRISVGSGFSRAALTAFLHAAREVIDDGTFGFADETLYISDLTAMF